MVDLVDQAVTDVLLREKIKARIDELKILRQKIVDEANNNVDRVNVAIGELEAILIEKAQEDAEAGAPAAEGK